MMITLLVAFSVGIMLGKVMLPVLHKLKFGQNIYELAPEAHVRKEGTPTMGGLVIAGAAIAAALVMNDYSVPMGQEHAAGHAADGARQPVHRLCGRHDQDPQGQERRPSPQAEDDLSGRCWRWRSPAIATSTRRSAPSSRCRSSAWNGIWASGISRL